MLDNKFLQNLSYAPAVYNEFFKKLSTDSKPEVPDIPVFTAAQLGKAVDNETIGKIKDKKNTNYAMINEALRAAKIGFTFIKTRKTPQEWVIGGIRGGYGSNI